MMLSQINFLPLKVFPMAHITSSYHLWICLLLLLLPPSSLSLQKTNEPLIKTVAGREKEISSNVGRSPSIFSYNQDIDQNQGRDMMRRLMLETNSISGSKMPGTEERSEFRAMRQLKVRLWRKDVIVVREKLHHFQMFYYARV
jgi:hypothetical protein